MLEDTPVPLPAPIEIFGWDSIPKPVDWSNFHVLWSGSDYLNNPPLAVLAFMLGYIAYMQIRISILRRKS